MTLPKAILLVLMSWFVNVDAQASGTGTTTRYWDCCKGSCAWPLKATLASGSNPVTSCDATDTAITDYNAVSGCDSGSTYMCSDQTPWAISETLSYGFAATSISGGTEASWCCACYALTFTSGAVKGKQLIVQATNTGGDLGSNQFDLAIPGGGFGIFNGCTAEWGTPSTGWGEQYGGISNRTQCDAFPSALQAGCYWRFDWFANADNPTVTFEQVTCPAALTAKSGCIRADDAIVETPTGSPVIATWTETTLATSSTGLVGTSTTGISTSTGTTIAAYAQCGGTGWSGGTLCATGYTCIVSSAYYSQCLPS